MNVRNNERFIVLIISIASVALSIESILLGWEFWVSPLLLVGALLVWAMHLSGNPDYKMRQIADMVYVMLMVFYHGVHGSSYYDVAIVIIIAMAALTLFDHVYILNMLFAEYWIVLAVQLYLVDKEHSVVFDTVNISRLFLHVSIVIMIYFICVKLVRDKIEMTGSDAEKEARIEAVDADMEDFLSNISHELRTPVNVVLGMSEIQLKKGLGDEALSIKQAGTKLAYQIEDIQDYTECKRNSIILYESEYICTSLINDVIMEFRLLDSEKKLSLAVDVDPMVPMKMIGDTKKLHKIFRHLLENSVKFTKKGGIYIHVYSEKTEYGVNLCIEVTDTGIGIDRKSIAMVSESMFQVNKKRNRSSGGIGLGLYIVYGFAHSMGGFVKIESTPKSGTTVRVTIPQKVVDDTPCLSLSDDFSGEVIFHSRSDKFKVPKVRDFYKAMAMNLASGLKVSLYSAETIKEIEHLRDKRDISVIFMGQEEYEDNTAYFEGLSKEGVVVAVSAYPGFQTALGSHAIVLPKPLYAYTVTRVINEGYNARGLDSEDQITHPDLKGLRVLVVDDEPMNLIVAEGIFKNYEMSTDLAGSGKEAVEKFRKNNYDVVFMDHMMPEMDGVEAMKLIKTIAKDSDKKAVVIALTANAVSGAREMFMREGFDGFIAKPMHIPDFEHVMLRVLAHNHMDRGGQVS